MDETTCQRLLALNRQFYATVAAVFNQTRMVRTPGLQRLLELIPPVEADRPLRVLDVGCGNGRFAWMLDGCGRTFEYIGVDDSEQLLALAQENTREMLHGRARFQLADLATEGWSQSLCDSEAPFDFVLCTATLQHLPSYRLRLAAVREMVALAGPAATKSSIVLSGWQFLSSERLAAKILPWESVGLSPTNVDSGDALLPWKQGTYAIRYVHQIDRDEMQRLAADAGLTVCETFRADGREGDLNLYVVLRS